MYFQKRDVGSSLFINQKRIQREEVKKTRQIVDRIINVIKLIGKRGLSIRGKSHEFAYFLEDESLDHSWIYNIVKQIWCYIKWKF